MNKSISKKKLIIFSIVLTILVIGFLRDFIFVNINNQLKLNNGDTNPLIRVASTISFINTYKSNQLNLIKWILTILFSGAYLGIACYSVWIMYNEKNYIKITIYFYLAILAISLGATLLGWIFTNVQGNCYTFSRYLMGMAQSPIVLMILIPVFMLHQKSDTN